MQAKQKVKQNDDVKIQNYILMKNQLQVENATLLKQREGIQQQFQYILSSNNQTYSKLANQQKDIQMNFEYPQPKKPHHYSFIQSVKSKLSEIINICEDHRAGEQLNAIADAEKQILGFLDDIQNKKSQSRVQRSSKIKKMKFNKTQYFGILRQENKDFGDQALQIIQQIQRKAFIEIQNLRNDKINLLKKLNQQIKSHNQQKKLRIFYQSKLKFFPKQDNSHGVNRMQVVAQQNQENYDEAQVINQQHPQNHLRIQKKTKGNKKYVTPLSHFNPQNPKNIYQINFADPGIQNKNANFQTFRSNNVTSPLQRLTKISPRNKWKFSQQQILNSLSNLKTQNQRLKQAFPIKTDKSQLRAQLYELSDRIRYYQQKIYSNNQNMNHYDIRQVQNLLHQGNYLSEQVKKLLRAKRMSQDYSKSVDLNKNQKTTDRISYQNQNNQQPAKKETLRLAFDYTRPQLQTFSPLDKTFHSQTFRSKFSPTKYENLIAQMKNATKE